MRTDTRRRGPLTITLTVLTAATTVLGLAACGDEPAPRQTVWVADDLLSDDGRFYTTCEDENNDRYEKEVWLSEEQAAAHAEGAPCPDGEVRTAPHTESEADEDAEINIKSVPRPSTSRTPSSSTARSSKAKPSAAPVTTTTTKKKSRPTR